MKNTIKKLAAVVLPVWMLSVVAQGAGFALYEYSARTTAMGGATVANGAEPASLATNPSLITELEGTQIQLGATVVTAHAQTTVNGDARALQKDVWVLPSFYVTHKWSDDVSFGLGGFSRYGLGGKYKNYTSWMGSNLAYNVKLETFSFTPTLAIKANDQFSVAMGLEAMTIDFTQNSLYGAGVSPTPGGYELHGTGVSWGGNFSFIYKPEWAEKWSLGAMYRTKVKHNLNGRITADGTFAPINIHTASVEGAINLPDSITAGLSFKPTDDWTLETGIVGTFWSSYDQILIQYKDNTTVPFIYPQKLYKETFRLNFGTEYMLNNNWAVRAGYVFDKSPINQHAMDTLVPVDDRHIVNTGFGYHNDSWSVDFSYSHIFAKDMKGFATNGWSMEYTQGRSDIFALTIGRKF